ncbi:MAG: RNA-binding protein [bacterium]|nr:RNA-binding protein [bacterium]
MEDQSSTVNPAKLFVGNLAYSVTDEQLKELFGQYGEVAEATVLLERQFGGHNDRPARSRGMGFVTFATADAAAAAVEALHDQEFAGRKLIVAVAKPRTDRPRNNFGGGNGGGRRW